MPGKLLNSFAWDFAGRSGSQVAGMIIGIILARLLTPSEFGLIGMAMVFIGMSGIFTNLGLSSALVQRKNPEEEHYSSSFWLNISAALILSITFFILAPSIAGFFKNDRITGLVRVLSLSLLISSFSVVQEARLRKLMRFDILSKARLISTILSGITGILMAFAGFGVWSLVVQTLFGGAITTIYYWFVSDWRPKILFRIRAIKELWAYSMNLFFSGILDTAYNQLDSLIIAKIFSPADLGLYSRAKTLNRFVIRYSSDSIGAVTFPAMSALQDDRHRMIELGLKAETLIAFVSFGLLGLLYVTAESLVLTLLGPKWEASVSIYRILCLSGFAYPVSAATLSMLKAAGDSRSYLKVEVWKKIVGITGLGIGFLFGLKGFLISLIITGALAVIMNMYVTGRSLNISVGHQLFPLVKYLLIAIISAGITSVIPVNFGLQIINFALISLIFVSLYAGMNRIFKTRGLELFTEQFKGFVEKIIQKFFHKK